MRTTPLPRVPGTVGRGGKRPRREPAVAHHRRTTGHSAKAGSPRYRRPASSRARRPAGRARAVARRAAAPVFRPRARAVARRAAAPVFRLDGFAPQDVLEAVREESATFLAGVPTL
ncbi:hypothetical protein, partial [Streptomyces minutiscleroticus]|uniref:hypothetical protein n=1 Tax=Streptomyces minutiscleroticus TaxID=68238 RepID=UPI0033308F14